MNEIKKLLYKQNPIANLIFIRKGVVYYETTLYDENQERHTISFQVPVDDMGDADFFETMSAKLLIRYLVVDDGDKEPIRRVDEIY